MKDNMRRGDKAASITDASMDVVARHIDVLSMDICKALAGSSKRETAERLKPILDSLWSRAVTMGDETVAHMQIDEQPDTQLYLSLYAELLEHVGSSLKRLTENPLMRALRELGVDIDTLTKEGK